MVLLLRICFCYFIDVAIDYFTFATCLCAHDLSCMQCLLEILVLCHSRALVGIHFFRLLTENILEGVEDDDRLSAASHDCPGSHHIPNNSCNAQHAQYVLKRRASIRESTSSILLKKKTMQH